MGSAGQSWKGKGYPVVSGFVVWIASECVYVHAGGQKELIFVDYLNLLGYRYRVEHNKNQLIFPTIFNR